MGEKSIPGFAVPDSVHQVKLVSPRKLPLRRTETSANDSAAGTSTVSEAISIFDGPDETPADGDAGCVAADLVAAGGAGTGTAAGGATVRVSRDVGGGDFVPVAGAVAGAATGATVRVSCDAGVVGVDFVAARGGATGATGRVSCDAGGGGAEFVIGAESSIGGLLSSCGNALRWLIIQKAPARSTTIPTTTATAKKDLGSLPGGGSSRSVIGAKRFAAPRRSKRSNHS